MKIKEIKDEFILLVVILLYIWFNNNKWFFFQIIFTLSFIINIKNMIMSLIKIKDVLKLIFIYIVNYYIIADHNPLFHFFFFWLPFESLFKAIFILILTSFCFKNNSNFFLQKYTQKISSIKTFIIVFIILSSIRFGIYMYNQKYYIYFISKNNLINPIDKYYIVAVLKNISPIAKDYFTEMKKLINYLGESNVYISIMENGDSNDTSAVYIKEFEEYLNKRHIYNKIVVNKLLVFDEEMDRVEKLVDLRNYAMNYLYELDNKIDYDHTKIIFLNDIIYNYQDIITLLSTNKGDYDAVCGMDYYESFYDVWVSHGIDGLQTRRYYPFFINKVAQDAYIDGKPIRVFSCWNGALIIQAHPFIKRHLKFRKYTKRRESECTLLCADLFSMGYTKIILNPNIIFAYTYEYYYKNKYIYFYGKHLFTYFYYYWEYGNPFSKRFKKNYNMIDLKSHAPIIDQYLQYNYIYYYQRDIY